MNDSSFLHPNTPACGLELVVLMGLPASGKSTYARTRLLDTHVRLGRDSQLVETALAAGESVVVDACHSTAASRRQWIEMGSAHNARVVGLYFAATASRCVARNRLRVESARVSDAQIFAALKRWERPSLDEGFHELWLVKALFDEMFLVSAWDGAEALAS